MHRNPHLISKYEDQAVDWLFGIPYAIGNDGKENKRLLWLSQHLRPLPEDPQFGAL